MSTSIAPPSVRLGLRARWRAAREARLTSERVRRRLAERIEEAIARSDTPPSPLSAAVPIARAAAGEARSALLDLAERLRSPRPVNPDGVRVARALLVDGGGPLYVPQEPGELRAAALQALDALDDRRDIR
ncbi:MAG TPA: hypothetical protein VK510_04705 [Solirubrobacteraceae bacterium]|nr:hypothetical protein [Solirubrobacteraceae bacterium]